jgi:adenylate cyclase
MSGKVTHAMFARYRPFAGHDQLEAAAARRPGRRRRVQHRTVMFTDLEGFTSLAETLPPTIVARLLRRHFGLLLRCIAAERGRVDKVMGDGLVALWGDAADEGPACAPALRAAVAIRAAMRADNAWRRDHGLATLRLRVGIHAGPLVATSLGRTIGLGTLLCGDTVNVAQRLEDAARQVTADRDVAILASEAVLAAAGHGFVFHEVGRLPVRGRAEPVTAFAVEALDQGAAPGDGRHGEG